MLSFSMPYIRISYNRIIWPTEYLLSSLTLPRIIEVILILFFLFQLIINKSFFDNLAKIFCRDYVFRLFLCIFLYVSLIQPILMQIFPLIVAPTAKGAIRGNVFLPIIAYIIGYNVTKNNDNVNIIFYTLILAGLFQAIAMLRPFMFPEYMTFGNFGYFRVELTTGEVLKLQRQSGFWDRSSQAADFMSIIICLCMAGYIHLKSKKTRILLSIIIGTLTIALLSTLQRIPFIAILTLFLFVMFGKSIYAKPNLNKKLIPIFLLLAIFIIAIIQYPYLLKSRLSVSSLAYLLEENRFKGIWPAYLNFIFTRPSVLIFGAGLGCDALGEYNMPMHMAHGHNQFLTWIAGIGLPMTILFVSSLIRTYNRAKICLASNILNTYEKTMASFCMMLLFILLIISLAESPLLNEPISILVFFISGITNYLYRTRIEETVKNNA